MHEHGGNEYTISNCFLLLWYDFSDYARKVSPYKLAGFSVESSVKVLSGEKKCSDTVKV